jgi:hypothetical protein
MLSHEYGWTIEYIKDLTPREINELTGAIKERTLMRSWIEERRFAKLAVNIYKMLGGKNDLKDVDLIGPAPIPEEMKPAADTGKLEEWHKAAEGKGLKTGGR